WVQARAAWSTHSRLLLGLVVVFSLCVGLVATSPAPSPAVSSRGRVEPIPLQARLAVARGLGEQDRAFWARRSAGVLTASNRRQSLTERFAPGAVTIATRSGSVALSAVQLSRGRQVRVLTRTSPNARRNRVSYRHKGIVEWYVNGSLGVEQGFTLSRRPD